MLPESHRPAAKGIGSKVTHLEPALTRLLMMENPEAFWVVFANLVLGVTVVACVLVVLFGVIYGVAARTIHRYRQSSELDYELKRLFAELEHRAG